MFTITNRETNETQTIEPQSKIEMTFSENWISVNIQIWSREHGISLNSEWLTLEVDAIPKNDLRLIGELVIEETTESEVIITGPYAKAFRTGDDMGFYYYVNQSLFPEHSKSTLRHWDGKNFHFHHESVLDYYSFNIDLEIPLTTLTATAWHEEANAKTRIEDLKKFFLEHFDTSFFKGPEIEETETCFKLTYTA
jgi:hypothetical protein